MDLPILSTILIALGLAMDAFAVSVASGVSIHRMQIRHAMLIAGFFGFFQALMPSLGWLLGRFGADSVEAFDHWIAFALLTGIGGKMIYEATFQLDEAEEERNPLNLYVLFALAIATSIDAFAVGITISFLHHPIVTPVIVIGLITFVTSLAGVYIGDHFGHFCEKKLEVAGGIILILIGTKILVEHTILS
ncbi:MAG: manganese efflux pump MntP [Planctomycetota bacterium]|jgi:putative Mn2+ efflux pump MntP